jgi:Zn finger protein HypA/HybF involved in hydrogenase expression
MWLINQEYQLPKTMILRAVPKGQPFYLNQKSLYLQLKYFKNEVMKNCPYCSSEVEDNFDLCWNCNFSFSENQIIEIRGTNAGSRDLDCLRCKIRMSYSGNFSFHEGFLTGIFTNKETFDLYLCPKCGKVEFFVPRQD